MKVKLSITLDDETMKLIDEHVNSQRFRNKSHAVEFAVRKLLEQKLESKDNTNSNRFKKILLSQKKQEGEMNV